MPLRHSRLQAAAACAGAADHSAADKVRVHRIGLVKKTSSGAAFLNSLHRKRSRTRSDCAKVSTNTQASSGMTTSFHRMAIGLAFLPYALWAQWPAYPT